MEGSQDPNAIQVVADENEQAQNAQAENADPMDFHPSGMDNMDMEDAMSSAMSSETNKSRRQEFNFAADPRIGWMCKCLEDLASFEEDKGFLTNDKLVKFHDFLEDPNYVKFFCWIEFGSDELQWSFDRAPRFYGGHQKAEDYQVIFYLKVRGSEKITIDNIHRCVMTQMIDRDPLNDILGKMTQDFCPKLLGENEWPDGVKKEFATNLHMFMCRVTEAAHKRVGRTQLYIPIAEDLNDIEACAAQKDQVQRLEAIVIYWTRQIKDLVTNQESQTSNDNSTPLDEINHWNARHANLQVLNKTLENKNLVRIIQVLKTAGSSYHPQFCELTSKIGKEFETSQDSLRFLSILQDPCRRIDLAQPKDIPKLVPEVLNCVRMIFELSSSYSNSERMRGLMTKISNQIISRCKAKIQIEDMLGRDVEKCMADLEESITCCQEWKVIAEHKMRMIKIHSTRSEAWDLQEDETIFAEVDAFIQRCKDLMEICDGQMQFALAGASCQMPIFGGTKGNEYTLNLQDLARSFKQSLQQIKALDYDILDVKQTRWHDDFGQTFKDEVKGIETFYTTIISLTFKHVSTCHDSVEMLENFQQLAKRQSIQEFVHTKAANTVYQKIIEEIKEIEITFDIGMSGKRRPPMSASNPTYGGLAVWALSLIQRLENAYALTQNMYFVPHCQQAAELKEKYDKMHKQLDNYITNISFKEWTNTFEDMNDTDAINSRLMTPILRRFDASEDKQDNNDARGKPVKKEKSQESRMRSNFDVQLLRVINETQYWNKIQTMGYVSLPHHMVRLLAMSEGLRKVREYIMTVVREYNNIQDVIHESERDLFSEHLFTLDKYMAKGLFNYNWEMNVDGFVGTSIMECRTRFKLISQFQTTKAEINDEIEKISNTSLLQIAKRLYDLDKFINYQESNCRQHQAEFEASLEKIHKKVVSTYQTMFLQRGNPVQRTYAKFVADLDKQFKEALKNAVKNSFHALQTHIKTEGADVVAIFKVCTKLDRRVPGSWKIVHEPSHSVITDEIVKLMGKIRNLTKVLQRLEELFRRDRDKLVVEAIKEELLKKEKGGGNFGGRQQEITQETLEAKWEIDVIESQKDYPHMIWASKSVRTIYEQIKKEIEKIKTVLDEDEKIRLNESEFRQLMNMQTERGKKRFLKATDATDPDDPVSNYRSTIDQMYSNMQELSNKASTQSKFFIQLDYTMLRNEQKDCVRKLITEIQEHLIKESKAELNKFLMQMRDVVDELKLNCTSLEMLKSHRERYADIDAQKEQWKARIAPIKKKFEFIKGWEGETDSGEVEGLNDEDQKKVDSLDDAWKIFLTGMLEAKNNIAKNNQDMKQEMESQIQDLKSDVIENLKNFQKECPKSVINKDIADKDENRRANDKIHEFRVSCQELRKRESDMLAGLKIFEMPQEEQNELTTVERQNDHLDALWTLKDQWDDFWIKNKDTQFYHLEIAELEDTSLTFRDLLRSKKQQGGSQMPVYDTLAKKIEEFIGTVKLLPELRDESMRERHWDTLRLEVKEEFNEKSDDFTLEEIFKLNFLEYASEILTLAEEAQKQLKVEKDLDRIQYIWTQDPESDLEIITDRSKATGDTFHKVASTENIMTLIEEHSVILATHKASPFYKEFQLPINRWEKNLADITSCLDGLILATSSWQYLESIFNGQPEIHRQLADEVAKFRSQDKIFSKEMARVAETRNAFRALVEKAPDFAKTLEDMNGNFATIKKDLFLYLDSKRGKFPRFYFLPYEDLLAIIGMGKDPRPLNQYIQKMFAGICALEPEPAPKGSKFQYTIKALISEGGEETIELDVGATDQRKLEVENDCESWLKTLCDERMKEAIQRLFKATHTDTPQAFTRRIREHIHMKAWVTKEKGQFLCTDAQIKWTQGVEQALLSNDKASNVNNANAANPIKTLKAQYRRLMSTYVDVVEKTPMLTALDRKKLTALIILEEHHREIIDKLYGVKGIKREHFEWLSQCRFTLQEPDVQESLFDVKVEQMNSTFMYGCEYMGNQPRLVVTPLTDKAYMTLTNAMAMARGGAPQGPAGTGKTETVKDLGKNLAYFVLVENCNPQMDPDKLSKLLAGISSSGVWVCFDEFNRISLDVLSVVASFFETIFDSIRSGSDAGTYLGEIPTKVLDTSGYFITMNPGYAGRSALPDNLSALFRPVAMMKADFRAIVKIEMMSVGFKESDILSIKIVSFYDMMDKQLSKAKHYEFQMRSLKSVLRAVAQIKQAFPQLNETSVAIKGIRDMNLAKLLPQDVLLFDKLFEDLFPDCEEPDISMDDLQIAIEDCLEDDNKELNEVIVVKAMQLFEANRIRWGVMIVGNTQSGKTTIYRVLEKALNRLSLQQPDKYKAVKSQKMNPKSISEDEFYGCMDQSQKPAQWQWGVFSWLLKAMISEPQTVNRWLILDGPVDTLWIESMNSLLDDSKLLTLNNGERMPLAPNCKLTFEVNDLNVASPATISRVGLIYMDVQELGYQPILNTWIQNKSKVDVGLKGDEYKEHLQSLVILYVYKMCKTKNQHCKELVQSSETANIRNFCHLYDAVFGNSKKQPEEDAENYKCYITRIFVFALIWSIGATIQEQSRKEIDILLRDLDPIFPHASTVYEYHVDPMKKDFSPWDDFVSKLPPAPGSAFHEIYVPTVDTARYDKLLRFLIESNQNVMMVGYSGVGKTKRINTVLESLPDEKVVVVPINFSAGTTAKSTQDIIMTGYSERARKFYPKNARQKVITFIDDFNMPRKEIFGAQPPIELVRQVMDFGFWYNRKNLNAEYIQDLQIITSMGEPGGGRTHITPRIISNFHMLNFTFPTEAVMRRIYEVICEFKFNRFYEDIKVLYDQLPAATIHIFNLVKQQFLPRPGLVHYQFNMRDISKVFQGIFKADKDFYDSKEQMVKLWGHEIQRVFQDRLAEIPGVYDHQTKLRQILDETLTSHLQGLNFKEHVATMIDEENDITRDPIFVDFMSYEDMRIYDEVQDITKMKIVLEEKLVEYNQQPKVQKLDMVLFEQAITMVTKVHRILSMDRGHLVLAGLPSVGRKSVTKLAAFVEDMNITRLEITKKFGLTQFRIKMKQVWELCAYNGRKNDRYKTVFMIDETDIVEESFLEDIQNILSSGLVPNLYTADELAKVHDEMKAVYKSDGQTDPQFEAKTAWFQSRVQKHLHIAYNVSQQLVTFSEHCRSYPALINNASFIFYFPWPNEGLYEVSSKFIVTVEPLPPRNEQAIARVCTEFYDKAMTVNALKIKQTLGRNCDLLPSLYTSFLSTYKMLLYQKRQEIGDKISKYSNGIIKLDEANEQVKHMSGESEKNNEEIAKAKQIAEQKEQEIQEQTKHIDKALLELQAKQKIIEAEKIEATNLAAAADIELGKAMPALEAADAAVDKLESKHIAEMKSVNTPHPDVHMVMMAVMIYLGQKTEWIEIKKVIGKPTFKNDLMAFDKENIPQARLSKVQKYTRMETFQVAHMTKINVAAAALASWVKAIEEFSQALKVVIPKREKKEAAEAKVKLMEEQLAEMQEKYNQMMATLEALKAEYAIIEADMARYKRDLLTLSQQIDRGEELISGLSGEKVRWKASQIELEDDYKKLVGDCLIAASMISFQGPYPSNYRAELNKAIIKQIKDQRCIDFNPKFNFAKFMTTDAQVRAWQVDDLPTDEFSTENAVLITTSNKWCTVIDPQQQFTAWIKKKFGKKLFVIDFKNVKYSQLVEEACRKGKITLLEDIAEEVDPTLVNIVGKQFHTNEKKKKKSATCFVGDREIDVDPKFQLYIATRIANPVFETTIMQNTTVVNFCVTDTALIEQCMTIVISQENANLESNRIESITKIAENNAKLQDLEDEILAQLNAKSDVSLLENVTLIKTLKVAQEASADAKIQQEQLRISFKKITENREMYKPIAQKASALYFVLFDLNIVEHMYQFSLKWYKDLFLKSIIQSNEQNSGQQEPAKRINHTHTLNVYHQACRTLFAKHKILLSLQMCVKLMNAEGLIDQQDYQFFLRGGTVLNREGQPQRPPNTQWITDQAWDNVCELEKQIEHFQGLSSSIQLNPAEWRRWFSQTMPHPENGQLPGEWETKCEDVHDLKKMVILRCFRQDRVRFAIENFINAYHKNTEFTTSKAATLSEAFEESNPETPIVFLMAPGVDPTEQLKRFAQEQDISIIGISLGKGQEERAKTIVRDCAQKGKWCFLSNCHLSVNLLPELENIIDEVLDANDYDQRFRIFMSAAPIPKDQEGPKFPISLLQRSIKMAAEPPKGIKANVVRMYDNMRKENLQDVENKMQLRKAIYGLVWFHSVVIERKKFQTLGWNVAYTFNDSDYSVCEDILKIYMGRLKDGIKDPKFDQNAQIPWDAVRVLIGECNYGGRVTDANDRLLMNTYTKEIFNDELVAIDKWKPSGTEQHNYGYLVDEGANQKNDLSLLWTPETFKTEIQLQMEEGNDPPSAFGQHPNAEIQSQINDTNQLLESIVALQPLQVQGDAASKQAFIIGKTKSLKEAVPEEIDLHELRFKLKNDLENPLNVVLIQELERFNTLLSMIKNNLDQLEKGVQGLSVITQDLEVIMQDLLRNKVPGNWGQFYFSMKPLNRWMEDLDARMTFFATWCQKGLPFVYKLNCFSYPQGFTTALLQRYSRKSFGANIVSIDKLDFDFIIVQKVEADIVDYAKDGAFVSGLMLEGAAWNEEKMHLCEPQVMQLEVPLPVIHFKPTVKKKTTPPNVYECPMYYYPNRQGTVDRESFIMKVELKCGDVLSTPPSFWIKRGAAILLSSAN